MKCTKSVVVFCDWWPDHTKVNTETDFFLGGGGGGVICQSSQIAVNCRTKFRNKHWLEKCLQLGTINHGLYFVKLA